MKRIVVSLSTLVLLLAAFGQVHRPVLADQAPCAPASGKKPLVLAFLGFQELPCSDLSSCNTSQKTAEELRAALGADMPAPYQTVLNVGQNLTDAIGGVAQYKGQPLELVKTPLKLAIKAAKGVVNLAGAQLAARAELQRARKDVNLALAADPDRPVYIVAYSWGTVSARVILSRLERQGVNVQGVVLIDPVHLMSPNTPLNLLRIFDSDSRRLRIPDTLKDQTVVYRQTGDPLLQGDDKIVTTSGTPVPSEVVTDCDGNPCDHGKIRTAQVVKCGSLAAIGCSEAVVANCALCQSDLDCNDLGDSDCRLNSACSPGDPAADARGCVAGREGTLNYGREPTGSFCDDGIPCTRDSCRADGGCGLDDDSACCKSDAECRARYDGDDSDDDCGRAACLVGYPEFTQPDGCWLGRHYEPVGNPCNDGLACTMNDQCNGEGGCTLGSRDDRVCNPGTSGTDRGHDFDPDCIWNTCNPNASVVDADGCTPGNEFGGIAGQCGPNPICELSGLASACDGLGNCNSCVSP